MLKFQKDVNKFGVYIILIYICITKANNMTTTNVSKQANESQILIDEMNALRKTQKSLKEFASANEFFAYTKDMAKKKAEILFKLQNIYQ